MISIQLTGFEAIQLLLWQEQLIKSANDEPNIIKRSKIRAAIKTTCHQIERQLLKDVTVGNFIKHTNHLTE